MGIPRLLCCFALTSKSVRRFMRLLQDSKRVAMSTMKGPSESAELRLIRPTTALGGTPLYVGERTAVSGGKAIPELA